MNTTFSTTNNTNFYSFRFEQYIIIWISALVDIIFSCLSLIRYFRFNCQRTHLTYVYHFSLGFSLILSLISTPLHTLTDYFWSVLTVTSDQQRRLLWNFDSITFFIASAGIGYSIAYASLERTFFIFYSQKLKLTWTRQFTPFLIIFSLCSIIITLTVLLSKCPLDNCQYLLFYFGSLTFQLIWFTLQFLIPFLLILIAIFFLIYRIEIHRKRIRNSLNRKRSRKKFQRILIHLNIYYLYYILSICPLNIYSFIKIDSNLEQNLIEILLINYSFISLHIYPILIYLLGKVKSQHRITYHQEQKHSPYIIITRPSIPLNLDEYQRTRL